MLTTAKEASFAACLKLPGGLSPVESREEGCELGEYIEAVSLFFNHSGLRVKTTK